MRNFSVITVAICLVSVAAEASDEDRPDIASSASPLLVLLAADDDTSIRIERQLVAELRLTLDGVQVEQIAIEREDFLAITLPEQLEVVQPLIRRFLARAAVWVVTGGRSGHLVQFVVSDRGNSTVRTVDAGSPEELALAVRELLDSAYLFNERKPRETQTVPSYFFAIGSTLSISGGMVGHAGASVTGGAGLEARFTLLERILLGLYVAGKLGPRESQDDGMGLGWRTDLGLFAGYLFKIGAFSAGPFGEISMLRSSFNAILGKGEFDKHSWWSFRGAFGLEMSLKLGERLSIFVDWTVGGLTNRMSFKRESNQSTVMTTPAIDYMFTLGLATFVL